MFDDVVDWVTSWSDLADSGFLKSIQNISGQDRLSLSTVIDFEEAVRSLLDDVTVMNNIIEGLDPETWRSKTPANRHEYDPDVIIGDKESGYLYRHGIDLHCPDESDGIDPVLIRPLPVVIHIDKTHVAMSLEIALLLQYK